MSLTLEFHTDKEYGDLGLWLTERVKRDTRMAYLRALRETAKWFAEQFTDTVSEQTRIQRDVVAKRVSMSKGRATITVTARVSPVRARELGPLTQLKPGAKAGNFYFHKSFVATMNARRGPSIYRRKGRPRFPVSEQGIAIELSALKAAKDLSARLSAYYEARWKHHRETQGGADDA